MTLFRTARLVARAAGDEDRSALQGVLDGAPTYHEITGGAPAEPGAAVDLLSDAGADPDRRLLLLWPASGGAAAGVVDVQLHWPEPGAAHVRLLLLREAVQGFGLGREAAEGLEEALRGEGFRALRLAVTRENGSARAFWERVGYGAVEHRPAGDTLHEKLL